MPDLKFHDAADIFPMMTDEETSGLYDSIDEQGQINPIEIYEGKVLDGRNRYLTCLKLGIEPDTIDVTDEVKDPVAHVLAQNLHRRHLSQAQLSMVGARSKEVYARLAKERMKAGGGDKKSAKARGKSGETNCSHPIANQGKSREQAGAAVGVSGQSVDRATHVLNNGVPGLAEAVDANKLSISTASDISKLPKKQQTEIVEAEDCKKKAREIFQMNKEAETPPPGQSRGVGAQHGKAAVDCLKRIPRNDSLRKRGFQIVSDFIRKNK